MGRRLSPYVMEAAHPAHHAYHAHPAHLHAHLHAHHAHCVGLTPTQLPATLRADLYTSYIYLIYILQGAQSPTAVSAVVSKRSHKLSDCDPLLPTPCTLTTYRCGDDDVPTCPRAHLPPTERGQPRSLVSPRLPSRLSHCAHTLKTAYTARELGAARHASRGATAAAVHDFTLHYFT